MLTAFEFVNKLMEAALVRELIAHVKAVAKLKSIDINKIKI